MGGLALSFGLWGVTSALDRSVGGSSFSTPVVGPFSAGISGFRALPAASRSFPGPMYAVLGAEFSMIDCLIGVLEAAGAIVAVGASVVWARWKVPAIESATVQPLAMHWGFRPGAGSSPLGATLALQMP